MASMEEDLRKNKSEASADELPYVHTFQADAQLKAEKQEYEESIQKQKDMPPRSAPLEEAYIG